MKSELAATIEDFFTQFQSRRYKKGEILIRANEDPSGIVYLKDGIVKEYAISKKGDELVVNIFKSSAFFPMSWAINNTKNKYFFEAVSDIKVRIAPKRDVLTFMKTHPDVVFDLLARVYKGTDGFLTKMAYLMSGNAYVRLITELIIHAKRFGDTDQNGRSIKIKITEKDLATQVGLTRETVSREINRLKEKKLIIFQKGMLTIKNMYDFEGQLLEEI